MRKEWLWAAISAIVTILVAVGGFAAVLGFSTPGDHLNQTDARVSKVEARINDHDVSFGEIRTTLSDMKDDLDELLERKRKK